MAVISFEVGEWQWLVRVPVDGRQAGGPVRIHGTRLRATVNGNGEERGERREEEEANLVKELVTKGSVFQPLAGIVQTTAEFGQLHLKGRGQIGDGSARFQFLARMNRFRLPRIGFWVGWRRRWCCSWRRRWG